MRKSTIHRRSAILAQLVRAGCNLPPGPERLNFSLLRAIRAGCVGMSCLVIAAALPCPAGARDCAVYDDTGPLILSPVREQDADLFAYCLWQEARGEGFEGLDAVAAVIRNRVYARQGNTWRGVLLKPYQFEGLAGLTCPEDVPDYFRRGQVRASERRAWKICYWLAGEYIGLRRVPPDNWTHFFRTDSPPDWYMRPGPGAVIYNRREIGKHTFCTVWYR